MKLSAKQLGSIIHGMRKAYAEGGNAMAYARNILSECRGENHPIATLLAYDLQAGSYVSAARENPETKQIWCNQLAELIAPVLPSNGSLLEVGVGEATTLAGVLRALNTQVNKAFGFDISWSRIAVAKQWLKEQSQQAKLFVGDLMHIPLADNSVDVVYSSHSLEPNGGREKEALQECLRVARYAVVLVEPIYELASSEAQARMSYHGYVRGLKATAENLGVTILSYRLLAHTSNLLNPSGALILRKSICSFDSEDIASTSLWQCPLTTAILKPMDEFFYAPDSGIAYPILRGVPMLAPEHAIIASRILDFSS